MRALVICHQILSRSWATFPRTANRWMSFVVRRNDASARFHYPILLLPKYFIGIILMRFVNRYPLPAFMEICLISYELCILKITYGPFKQPLHFVCIFIAEAPYLGTLVLFVGPLFLSISATESDIINLAWDMRICVDITAPLIYLWTQVSVWSEKRLSRVLEPCRIIKPFTINRKTQRNVLCRPLLTFELEGNTCLVYTDNAKDQKGNIQLYVSRYSIQGKRILLTPINDEKNLDQINRLLTRVREKVSCGTSIDSSIRKSKGRLKSSRKSYLSGSILRKQFSPFLIFLLYYFAHFFMITLSFVDLPI